MLATDMAGQQGGSKWGYFPRRGSYGSLGEKLLKPYGLAGSCHWLLHTRSRAGGSCSRWIAQDTIRCYLRPIHHIPAAAGSIGESLLLLLAVGGAIVRRWQ